MVVASVRMRHVGQPASDGERNMQRLLMGCGLVLSIACGRPPAPTSATEPREAADAVVTGVTAVRVAKGVRITNGTDGTIPYVVWDLGFLGLLGPCDERCPLLKPGERVTVEIGREGFTGNGPTAVYWWSAVQAPNAAVQPPNSIILP